MRRLGYIHLWNDKISEVDRCRVKFDQHIVIADFWERMLMSED